VAIPKDINPADHSYSALQAMFNLVSYSTYPTGRIVRRQCWYRPSDGL